MNLKVIFSALLAALSVSAVAQIGVPVDQAKASGLPFKPDAHVMQKAAAALPTAAGAAPATKAVPPASLPSTSHRIIEAPKTAPVKQAPVTMKKIVTTAADGPEEDEEIAPAPAGVKPASGLPNIGGGAPVELRNAIAARINTAVDSTAAARLEDPAAPQPGELRNDIQVRAGVTEVVKISKAFLTRIITPFANPGAKTVNDMEVDVVGSTLYITPSTDEPAGLFIYDQDDPERAITLQLYPQDIPQRDISLRLVGSRPTQGGATGGGRGEGKGAGADKSPQPYTTDIVDTLSEVAKGRVPTGFSLAKPLGNEADCVVPGAEVKLGQLIDGQRTKIAVLVLKNVSSKAIEVNEQSCYRAGVMGVAVWPNPVVDSGKETEIYVMLRHEEPSFDTGSTRPRLVK